MKYKLLTISFVTRGRIQGIIDALIAGSVRSYLIDLKKTNNRKGIISIGCIDEHEVESVVRDLSQRLGNSIKRINAQEIPASTMNELNRTLYDFRNDSLENRFYKIMNSQELSDEDRERMRSVGVASVLRVVSEQPKSTEESYLAGIPKDVYTDD